MRLRRRDQPRSMTALQRAVAAALAVAIHAAALAVAVLAPSATSAQPPEPPVQPPAAEAPRSGEQPDDGQAPNQREVREKTAALMEQVKTLDAVYQEWVQSVAGLMSIAELEYFVNLQQDYRR